jgi:glucokinase
MASAIGIDIGGTNLRGARVAADGRILATARAKSAPDPQVVLERIETLIRELDDPEVGAIGLGVPGRVDFDARKVLSGGYVDLSKVPLAATIEERFGRPVILDNDCTMALIAEAAHGAAKDARSAAMLTIGTGIGGAVMEARRIVRGRQSAGQLGHISVDPNGLPCLCGKRGCVETVSSGTSLGRHIRDAGFDPSTTAATILALADEGHENALRVLAAWAKPLRIAIDDLVTTLEPDVILLGGGLGYAAFAAVSRIPVTPSWFEARIAPALLGDDAGVIGAALAALEAHRSKGKRLVLVNGVPASGKSSVARALSQETGWPVLSLDSVKNPFLEEIEGVDRPFNRKLGRASMSAMFAVFGEAPAGSTMIMDAWFGFQPREWIQGLLDGSGATDVTEIWCSADPDEIGARYASRASSRLPGHPGADYVPELIELAKRAAPLGIGRLIEIDTAQALDLASLKAELE